MQCIDNDGGWAPGKGCGCARELFWSQAQWNLVFEYINIKLHWYGIKHSGTLKRSLAELILFGITSSTWWVCVFCLLCWFTGIQDRHFGEHNISMAVLFGSPWGSIFVWLWLWWWWSQEVQGKGKRFAKRWRHSSRIHDQTMPMTKSEDAVSCLENNMRLTELSLVSTLLGTLSSNNRLILVMLW